MKDDFVSKGRSVSDLKTHLVLTTKYRRKAITSEMLQRLHAIVEELLIKWDCKLIEFNGEADHVHILFQYHPDLQLSTLIGNIKSITSRRLRQEFAHHLSHFYTKDVFWNGSYFVASCGGVTISTLKQYIKSQDSAAFSGGRIPEASFADGLLHPQTSRPERCLPNDGDSLSTYCSVKPAV